MIKVYILNKENALLNDKGLQLIKNVLKTNFGISEGYEIKQDISFGTAENLAKDLLKNQSSSYIFVIVPNNIMVIKGRNVAVFIVNLQNNPYKPSWEIAYECCIDSLK